MWAICEPNLHSAVRNWPRIDKGSSATHRAHTGAGPHRKNKTADHRSRYLTTLTRGIAMKKLFSITAAAALMMYGGAAIAAELPTYEVMGFPITRHQVAVLGGSAAVAHPDAYVWWHACVSQSGHRLDSASKG